MQIQIVRHHRRAENAEREIEHLRIAHNFGGRRKAPNNATPIGIGHRNLDGEADSNHAQQSDDKGFDPAKAEVLHPQHEKHIERGQDHADLERDAEQEIETDSRTNYFCEIGRADRDFRQQPQWRRHGTRKCIAARLCQIPAGRDAKPRAQRLQHDRHDVRHQRDGEQRVAELRAARERSSPVAGVHVTDGDEVPWAEERHQALPERTGRAGGDSAENFRK